jgi:hypothetical protein
MPSETIVIVDPQAHPQIELGNKRSNPDESDQSDQFDRFEDLTRKLVNTPKPKPSGQ